MSLSKLESLPNEILADIIENYINGIDVVIAFNHQLNQRFNDIIFESQRLRFDFMQCREKDFRFCMGLLGAYVGKIQELAISEYKTPNQVHAFLSFFPSFDVFKRLRTLYFQFDQNLVDPRKLANALDSLLKTKIETLAIKAACKNERPSFGNQFQNLFRINSLRKLAISTEAISLNWNSLSNVSSNIEHLTISGVLCSIDNLESLLKANPRLKHLDIQLRGYMYYHDDDDDDEAKKHKKRIITIRSQLRTLVLYFDGNNQTTVKMLADYFPCMPVLKRLEVKAPKELVDADAWQLALQNSLPELRHFLIRTNTYRIRNQDIKRVLDSFQTSYWLERKNFNVIITHHQDDDIDPVGFEDLNNFNQDEFKQPVKRYWIAPNCNIPNDSIHVGKVISLDQTGIDNGLTYENHLENVECLDIHLVNSLVVKWMTTYIDCSKIKKLVTITLEDESTPLFSVLEKFTNISTLHINLDYIRANKDFFMRKPNRIQNLGLSFNTHRFDEDNIIMIGQCFPKLEHLAINTRDFHNVPILKTHAPYLRTITFKFQRHFLRSSRSNDDYDLKVWAYKLQQNPAFSLRIFGDYITVWIDETILNYSEWIKLVQLIQNR